MSPHAVLALLACFALSSASMASPRVTIGSGAIAPGMRALDIHVGGRVHSEPLPSGARRYAHEWPGVYFEAAFTGSSVVLGFDDAAGRYRLLIDDQPPIALPEPGRAAVRIDALTRGPHRLRLEKLTEGAGAFLGFHVPASASPGRVAARARQIELIGDSSMTGYGNLAGTRECTQEEVARATDTQQAYPALVGKHFDADYQILARSGHGLVRNYGGFAPDRAMARIHRLARLDPKQPYSDPRWHPQIIVIRLIADLLAPLNPSEKWPSFAALEEDYVQSYGAMVAELHRHSPGASFLIWWFDEANIPNLDAAAQAGRWRQSIAEAARAAGAGSIHFLPMRDLGFDNNACDSHYSLADHRKLADWLIGYIEARPELWRPETFPAAGASGTSR